MGMYRIITLFTLLIDDYFPLGGPPDRLNDFPLWKSPKPLRMIFPLGSPPDASE